MPVQHMVVRDDPAEPTVTLAVRCPLCSRLRSLRVPTDGYHAWIGGMAIQNALPGLTAAEREQLISGFDGDCFDSLFRSSVIGVGA